jgi:hypothetical protein
MERFIDLREQASYLRAGIALGLLHARDAIAWADVQLSGDAPVPLEVTELALAAPDQDVRVRELLGELAYSTFGEAESPVVVSALLDLLRADCVAAKRSVVDTLAVLRHIAQALPLESDFKLALWHLATDAHEPGPTEPDAAIAARIALLLAPMTGARLRFPTRVQ